MPVEFWEQDMSTCQGKASRWLAGRPPGVYKLTAIPSNIWDGMGPRECQAFGRFTRNPKPGEMQQRVGLTSASLLTQRVPVFKTKTDAEGAWMAKAFGLKELPSMSVVVVPWLGPGLWIGGINGSTQIVGAGTAVGAARDKALADGLAQSDKLLLLDLLRVAPAEPTQRLRRIADLLR